MNDEPRGLEPKESPEHAGGTWAEPAKKLGVMERITGIFSEPSHTFRALKAHPNWLVIFLISALSVAAFTFVFMIRVPYETRRQAQLEKFMKLASQRVTDEFQLQKMREEFERRTPTEESLRQKLTGPSLAIVGLLVVAVIGGALYLIGVIIMGQRITFKQALVVWVYSDLPRYITSSILLIILMYVKSPDEIDPVDPSKMLTSNLGFLVNEREHIVLHTIANNIDVFQIWSLILAVIGLTIIPEKMKRGQAIGIVLTVWLLGLLLKIGANVFFGGLGL